MSSTPADSGHKVAVIGAGPAGLSAAFYLRKKGHPVTVFEARSKAGGMMRYGIPFYRLPEDILDKEISQVLSTGIELKTDQKLGVDFEIEQLKEQGFEAVFVAVGAQLSRKIELEGSELDDVQWGVEFLGAVADGSDVSIKERVAVIGGGNVAVDVALTALRLGAKEVKLACLENREEMPANSWEIEQARDEGVEMLYSWGPEKILENDGKVTGLDLVRCTSVFDEEGKFCPYFDDTKTTIEADQVILAIGQASETAFCKDFCFLDDEGFLPVQNGLIRIEKITQETEMKGVYSGGDAANGPSTVIEAIAAGRRAAMSIDKYLGGDGNIELGMQNAECGNGQPYDGGRDAGFAELKRVEVHSLPLTERHAGFSEVELCLSEEQAKIETHRCLQCDLEICLAQEKRRKEYKQ
jgi:NADPH-dependent glutamate synthase beta subunit-like oxidoreductase